MAEILNHDLEKIKSQMKFEAELLQTKNNYSKEINKLIKAEFIWEKKYNTLKKEGLTDDEILAELREQAKLVNLDTLFDKIIN